MSLTDNYPNELTVVKARQQAGLPRRETSQVEAFSGVQRIMAATT